MRKADSAAYLYLVALWALWDALCRRLAPALTWAALWFVLGAALMATCVRGGGG